MRKLVAKYEVVCFACGTAFLTKRQEKRRRFCSHRCYNRTQAREARGYVAPYPHTCKWCKRKFVPELRHQWAVTCSKSCSQKVQRSSYKAKARRAVMHAVAKGTLDKPETCSNCHKKIPKQQIQGHHHKGYSWKHRLDVIWLCRACHIRCHLLVTPRDAGAAGLSPKKSALTSFELGDSPN